MCILFSFPTPEQEPQLTSQHVLLHLTPCAFVSPIPTSTLEPQSQSQQVLLHLTLCILVFPFRTYRLEPQSTSQQVLFQLALYIFVFPFSTRWASIFKKNNMCQDTDRCLHGKSIFYVWCHPDPQPTVRWSTIECNCRLIQSNAIDFNRIPSNTTENYRMEFKNYRTS